MTVFMLYFFKHRCLNAKVALVPTINKSALGPYNLKFKSALGPYNLTKYDIVPCMAGRIIFPISSSFTDV